MKTVALPNGRVWLRVADPDWLDPLDPTNAAERGGRWNPPSSFRTLYLNGDVGTARLQLDRLLAGTPVRIDDLVADAFVLVAATIPRSQECADVASAGGLAAAGLPATYPCDDEGRVVKHAESQAVGVSARAAGLRGVWCRSASTPDGQGRELAWFPATIRSRARAVWRGPLPLARWLDAERWEDIGFTEQGAPR